MRILITGGAGYIGSHVCNLLLDKGFKVTVIDNLITGNKELVPKKAKLIIADIADEKKIEDVIANEKFDLIQDPKEFLDNEFSKLNDPQNLNFILSNNLSQKDLTKIYNLIIYKFTADLVDLGFETVKNREINFSDDVTNANQIIEQIQLQKMIVSIHVL